MEDIRDRILRPGVNCGQLARAHRAAVLIDGESYFAAFRQAAMKARRQMFILGWDIHSKVELLRGDAAVKAETDGAPITLGPLLNHLAQNNPELEIYILIWNYSMLLSLERDPNLRFNLGWTLHPRVHFHLDDEHPIGASQHQKIVVIDGQIGFCGGLDLSHYRWDSSDHEPDDPRRTTPAGDHYGPYHDIMMIVDGEPAAALAELCTERWQRATRKSIDVHGQNQWDAWPETVQPWFKEVDVAVVRTEPSYKSRQEVREVETLYRDSIRSAQRSIFIENQFFTSTVVCEALEERLREEHGPEVVIILPKEVDGWVGNKFMEFRRVNILKRVLKADVHGRLRLRHPWVGEQPKHGVMIHAKLMVVDDIFLRIGSSNLSNRSMGMDTECDLAIEASSPEQEAGVRRLRNELLAMHLGFPTDEVDNLTKETGSVVRVVDLLSDPERPDSKPRGLGPLEAQEEQFPELVSEAEIVDPKRPLEIDRLLDIFIPDETTQHSWLRAKWLWVVLGVLALVGLAGAWHFTALSDYANREVLAETMAGMARGWTIYPLIVLAYLIGGLVMFPVTVLIGATAILLEPLPAMLTAFAGTQVSAIVLYFAGMKLGRERIQSMAGSRLNRISKHLAKHGMLSVTLIRILPVAPYTIVNIVAGASHIRFVHYVFGTLLGMTPGILAVTIFTDRLLAFLRQPDLSNVLIMIAALVFLVVLTRWLKRRFT
ncbi:Phosphatidylserine/phosphatidylglycerophosphate/cardiolipin synthase [Desulfonatronum thiosulfatophilum]|uniref:Phosphatidylserine/phosphatidylglycerophosphate/cardiolipin synthase n=1 Tax=Desulfonatronum thiosulfatophilum TaxID=617002 RepID=A0A1G6CL15_9BACT|nr:VTT domain-containing protein [Desulfonatronum thiosulfatophilum]SDB33587.1 Phosphatidylserine/phosphatidylglycerophosphate/cardiolipin synthase [Desulfonatronum thiosulfatophilum]